MPKAGVAPNSAQLAGTRDPPQPALGNASRDPPFDAPCNVMVLDRTHVAEKWRQPVEKPSESG